MEESCHVLTVRNKGCGLNIEELPHIFESFYRGSNSKQIVVSGLDLYICCQLVSEMDGDIL